MGRIYLLRVGGFWYKAGCCIDPNPLQIRRLVTLTYEGWAIRDKRENARTEAQGRTDRHISSTQTSTNLDSYHTYQRLDLRYLELLHLDLESKADKDGSVLRVLSPWTSLKKSPSAVRLGPHIPRSLGRDTPLYSKASRCQELLTNRDLQ